MERARSGRLVGGWPRSPGGDHDDDDVDDSFGDVDIDDDIDDDGLLEGGPDHLVVIMMILVMMLLAMMLVTGCLAGGWR